MVLASLLLAGTYLLVVGSFTAWDVAFAVPLSAALVWTARDFVLPAEPRKPPLLWRVIRFPAFFAAVAGSVAIGIWRVCRLVAGSRAFRPGVLVVRLPGATPTGLTVMGLVQTLAPGSVLLEIRAARCELVFYVVGHAAPAELRAELSRFYRRWQRPVFP
ncbi:MAG TPA: Na+/H+ antiporter subunit E [Vulgatibacter sp.]